MKLFILVSRVPYPLEKGDKLRAYHQIKRLAQHHEVFLCCLNDAKVTAKAEEHLRQMCSKLQIVQLSKVRIFFNLLLAFFSRMPFQVRYFYQKQAQRKVDQAINDFKPDHIYCQLVRTTEYVKNKFEYPKTLDYMDTLSKGMERRTVNAPFYLKFLFKAETRRLIHYENLMFEHFDHCSIISEQDRELIYHSQRHQIAIIPNGVDTEFFAPQNVAKTYDLVFTGNMNYPPNVDSVAYLVERILPLIHSKRPEVRLLVSGVNPTRRIILLAEQHPKVEVSGWVEDIRDSYACAKIFLAPMQIGTGLQNKLLEAMAMGIPCITSNLANNAIGATPNDSILIGKDPQDYAKKVIELLDNKDLRQRLADNGNKLVHERFNWNATTRKLEALMANGSAIKDSL